MQIIKVPVTLCGCKGYISNLPSVYDCQKILQPCEGVRA